MEVKEIVRQDDIEEKRKCPRIDFHLRVKVRGQLTPQEVKNFRYNLLKKMLMNNGFYEDKIPFLETSHQLCLQIKI